MIDIKILRENPELVKSNCLRRGCEIDIDMLCETEKKHRNVVFRAEALRAERNRLSKECKDNPDARERVKTLKDELAAVEAEQEQLQKELDSKLGWLPNFLAPEVPGRQRRRRQQGNKKMRLCSAVFFQAQRPPGLGRQPRHHRRRQRRESGSVRLLLLERQRRAALLRHVFLGAAGAGQARIHSLYDALRREASDAFRHRLSAFRGGPDLLAQK